MSQRMNEGKPSFENGIKQKNEEHTWGKIFGKGLYSSFLKLNIFSLFLTLFHVHNHCLQLIAK